jgi:hypothetical protein
MSFSFAPVDLVQEEEERRFQEIQQRLATASSQGSAKEADDGLNPSPKKSRAALACDTCRVRKIRCDNDSGESCTRCMSKGRPCVYSRSPRIPLLPKRRPPISWDVELYPEISVPQVSLVSPYETLRRGLRSKTKHQSRGAAGSAVPNWPMGTAPEELSPDQQVAPARGLPYQPTDYTEPLPADSPWHIPGYDPSRT